MFQKSLDTTVQKVDEIRENFSKELKTIIKKKKKTPGPSLAVQWLRLCTSTSGGTDLNSWLGS